MKKIEITTIEDLARDGYAVLGHIEEGSVVYIATLPHNSGNAALGCRVVANEKEFEHFNAQANKLHSLYSVEAMVVGA